jgi:hypothetical protein
MQAQTVSTKTLSAKPCTTTRSGPRIPLAKRAAFRNSYRPNINRAGMHGSAAVVQMAEDMRMFAAVGDCLTENDAEVLGWTRAQISLHAAPAREYANRAADQ